MNAMPLLVGAIAIFLLAYRFYFSFIAAKVAVINDSLVTPANRLYDKQNYQPELAKKSQGEQEAQYHSR